ncbi:hypothetical protein T4B_4503 [Trichinella pseudospiralis]|uniref:Transmembrane protein n=1 Tax=Trichinella pseudospiralis TaxID=6337 RepID=A0A0V1ITA2_TRIPS|nr:hypothetical protein T4B_4503 [Trichinella pseudospiralis]
MKRVVDVVVVVAVVVAVVAAAAAALNIYFISFQSNVQMRKVGLKRVGCLWNSNVSLPSDSSLRNQDKNE